MRTTIRIDDDLLREAKSIATASGKTLAEVIENALRESLARRHQTEPRKRVVLPTFMGDGVHPGVNLDDWASVVELMDKEDAAT